MESRLLLLKQSEILPLPRLPVVVCHAQVQVLRLIFLRYQPGHDHLFALPLRKLIVVIILLVHGGGRCGEISRHRG